MRKWLWLPLLLVGCGETISPKPFTVLGGQPDTLRYSNYPQLPVMQFEYRPDGSWTFHYRTRRYDCTPHGCLGVPLHCTTARLAIEPWGVVVFGTDTAAFKDTLAAGLECSVGVLVESRTDSLVTGRVQIVVRDSCQSNDIQPFWLTSAVP